MPRLVKGPDGVTHSFPDDVTDDEVRAALGGDQAPPKGQTAPGDSFADKLRNAASMLGNTALGFGKAAAHTALDAGEALSDIRNPFSPTSGTLREAVDTLYAKPGLSAAAMAAAREATAYKPLGTEGAIPERIGAGLETAAEMAVPVGEAAAAIPSTARAGRAFQDVMGAAKSIPINTSGPGDVALRIAEMAQRGGGTQWGPAPVRQFIQYVTDPKKPEMTYEVARDFASNISRLSANEMMKLPPAMQREVAGLRVALNKSVAEAAGQAGKGIEYAKAMNEYARAKQLEGVLADFGTGVKKAVPYVGIGTAIGAGSIIGKHLKDLWGSE